MRKKLWLWMALLCLVVVATFSTGFAQTSVNVYVMNPYSGSTGAKGTISGGYWIGEIPVKVSSATVPEFQTVAYCIDPNKVINLNQMYSATLRPVTDSSAWRSISYLLTWNYPTENFGAAATQVAIWRLLNGNYQSEPWLDVSIYNAGKSLADSAAGRDVARRTDQFTWIWPAAGSTVSLKASPDEVTTLRAQLTSANGVPRPNVRVDFSAILNAPGSIQQLGSTYVNPLVTHTDSQGVAQVTVRVPPNAPLGSTLEVKASTRGMWTQQYVDVTNTAAQDLLGIGETFELSTSCNLVILAHIMVVPESPLGALAALGAFGAAFAVYKVKAKSWKQKKA